MQFDHIEKCQMVSRAMRKDILDMTLHAGATGGHLGGSLSLVEILAILFNGVLRFDPQDAAWPQRDRLILSKGHGTIALYAAMHQAGLATDEDIASFKSATHWMTAHPSFDVAHRLEFTSGSLGQGLSFAAGAALARLNDSCRYFVILGDGECNEGQVWEAAMFAAHHKLRNLIAIVDKNSLQYDGPTEKILNMGDDASKWTSFGWRTAEVDGHDINALQLMFDDVLTAHDERPKAIIAHTVKGRGVSFMENNPQWHHGRLSQKQYDKAIAELEVENA
jgi:transketolase